MNLTNETNAILVSGQGVGTIVDSFSDTTAAHFAAGTVSNVRIAPAGDGELSLLPAMAEDFGRIVAASRLELDDPCRWLVPRRSAGGQLRLIAALAGSNQMLSPATRSNLSRRSTASPIEHVGFATDFGGFPFAIFSIPFDDAVVINARTDRNSHSSYGRDDRRFRTSSVSTGAPRR